MGILNTLDKMKFDKRILELNITNGVISKSDYDSHLANLRDLTDVSEKLEISEPRGRSTDVETPKSSFDSNY